MRTTFDHSLRIMRLIASAEDCVSSTECSEALGIGTSFTRTLLSRLKNSGLLIAELGKQGGYRLAAPAWNITLLDVLEAVDTGAEKAKDEAMRAGRDEPRIDAAIASADRAYLKTLSQFTVAHLLDSSRSRSIALARKMGRAS